MRCFFTPVSLMLACFFTLTATPPDAHGAKESLAVLPMKLPAPRSDDKVVINLPGSGERETTINGELQTLLNAFIAERGSPIAAVIVADARTGDILAMAEGRSPASWGGTTHTALHAKFPAASLFKTVVSTAAFEVADFDAERQLGLPGGCGNVEPSGLWMNDNITGQNYMTLRRAYGFSCNSFFAKMAVNTLGIGIINDFARKFGYGVPPKADFDVEAGSLLSPSPTTSSTYTIGRYAAGFGMVSTSAVQVAAQMLAIANDGKRLPLRLFKDTPIQDVNPNDTMMSPDTARRIRKVMEATVRGGTASFAFNRGRPRRLRDITGGKTGTLMGRSPFGLTTLFSGIMPLQQPEVVVASIVILEDHWIIKAPSLAAEALSTWVDLKDRNGAVTTAGELIRSRPLRYKAPRSARKGQGRS
jgi:peptidoglycan glycosyltransferase